MDWSPVLAELVKAIPVIVGGSLAVAGGVAGQYLTHHFTHTRETEKLIREKAEELLHEIYAHGHWLRLEQDTKLSRQSDHIRRDLSGSGLLIIVYKCSLLREWEERFESQSSASRSGIALGMSPSGVFPQVVDHHLEGATIPRPIAVAQSAKQLR